jgi:two-component system capsular synthesis response regulator RcsB
MMFKKVLIAEDHESASISVQKTLTDLNIDHDSRNYVFYCDDALSRIKKALSEGEPYELLITDLSFDNDKPQSLHGGIELIQAARNLQPDLKVLVFSIDNRSTVAIGLLDDLDIDAYVPKARHDAKDLKQAMEKMAENKKYLSPNIKKKLSLSPSFVFTEYDKTIISMLAKGRAQKEIPLYLQKNSIKPSSLSSIEKRLNTIKTILDISSNEQLVAYCKDNKII